LRRTIPARVRAVGHGGHVALAYPAVVALLLLGGCESIAVGLHLRTRLDKLPVTSLAASLAPQSALSPGSSGRLVIIVSIADGRQLATVGPGQGKVLFDSFSFQAQLVQVDGNGVVSLPADPRVSDARVPRVHIGTVGHPEVVADLDIPVRYDVAFAAHFSGHDGHPGFDGMNGSDGMAGSAGSSDLNNPSAGGNGSDGSNGGDGSDGGPGERGQSVHVWVTLKPGPHPLLQVRVAGSTGEQFFLVDPQGGSLAIDANGGAGGRGGSGGRGGRGGSGGSGFPAGLSGLDGRSGFDGHQGAAGAAGTIAMEVDPRAQPFLDRIQLSNHSGSGRPGAPPEVHIGTVAALW
jgi:hypothetical protein